MTPRATSLDIAALLAPGAPGGVVEVDGHIDMHWAREQAQQLGARLVLLAGVASKQELLTALAIGLELPGWFGMNWDALEEALGAPERAQAGAMLIVWPRPEALVGADPSSARTFRAVVSAAARARHERGHGPLVLLAAASPGAQTERQFDMAARPGRVHHVAVVVRDLDAALSFYRDKLRLELDVVMPIESDGVRIGFLPVGESSIELVQPTRADTGVARFLESRGEGFHHVCLEVDDLAAELDRLAGQGIELIDTAPRPGAEGPVAFIHPRSCYGVLVELIEAPGGPAWKSLGYG